MFSAIWITLCLCVGQLFGWQAANKEKEPCFIVPSEDALAVTASQRNCPIEFVGAYTVAFLSGGGKDVFRIRNRSAKLIRAYTIAIVNSEGTGTEDSLSISSPAAYFRPGEIRSNDRDIEVIPFTDQIRRSLKLDGEMKVVKIFFVVRVQFADGSEYSAEPEYKSLKRFFERNATSSGRENSQKDRPR